MRLSLIHIYILPKSVKPGKISQWLMERAHEEGLRPVDVVLTSAQNKHAIKEVIDLSLIHI